MDVLRSVTVEEVAAQHAELLPTREALGLIDINIAPITAVSLGIAVNAATINSQANAVAANIIGVIQSAH